MLSLSLSLSPCFSHQLADTLVNGYRPTNYTNFNLVRLVVVVDVVVAVVVHGVMVMVATVVAVVDGVVEVTDGVVVMVVISCRLSSSH